MRSNNDHLYKTALVSWFRSNSVKKKNLVTYHLILCTCTVDRLSKNLNVYGREIFERGECRVTEIEYSNEHIGHNIRTQS